MSEHNPRPLAELIDPGWARALAPVEGRVHELGAMLATEVEEGRGYLPAGTDGRASVVTAGNVAAGR